MEKSIQLRESDGSPAATEFLLALMDRLESDKQKVTAAASRDEQCSVLLRFANDVFDKGDAEDRAGAASKATARTFYAAGVFFDALVQFGDLEPEAEAKKKYAKWKVRDPDTGGPEA